MKKKIVFFLYDLKIGGTEQVIVRLSNYLVSKGYKIEILTVNNTNNFEEVIHPEVEVTSFKTTRISHALIPLANFIKHSKIDFFISNVWPITVLSAIAFLFKPSLFSKLILIEHCHLSEEWKEKSFIFKLLQSLSISIFYNLSNKVISVSKGVNDDLVRKGLKRNKSLVIHNPAYTKPTIPKLDHSIEINNWSEGNHIKLISVGTLKRQKNYPNLLKALDILGSDKEEGYKLLIVGEGPERPNLEKIIEEKNLGNKVILLGNSTEPVSLINLADVFILSSDFEGFGLVLVEALSVGKTIVSTNCKSGPDEILGNNEFGYLCKVGDPVDLAEKIRLSINNKFDREKLKNRAKEFSVEAIGLKYEEVFNKIETEIKS